MFLDEDEKYQQLVKERRESFEIRSELISLLSIVTAAIEEALVDDLDEKYDVSFFATVVFFHDQEKDVDDPDHEQFAFALDHWDSCEHFEHDHPMYATINGKYLFTYTDLYEFDETDDNLMIGYTKILNDNHVHVTHTEHVPWVPPTKE